MQSSPAQYRFLHDNRGLYTSSSHVAYTVAHHQESLDLVPNLIYPPSSPESESSTSPVSSPRTSYILNIPLSTELVSTTPERVRRPRNAFIIFRCDYNPKIKAWIEAITTKRKTKKNKTINQNIVSIIAGRIWRVLSDEERQPYLVKAGEVKLQHRIQYPEYRYTPPSNRRVKRVDSAPVKRIRAQKPYSRVQKNATNDVASLESNSPPLVPTKQSPFLDHMSTDRIRTNYYPKCYFNVDIITPPTVTPVESQFGYRPELPCLSSLPILDWQTTLQLPSTTVSYQSPSFDAYEPKEALDALKAIDFESLSSLCNEPSISQHNSQTSFYESKNMGLGHIEGYTSNYQAFVPTYQNANEDLEQLINQYQ